MNVNAHSLLMFVLLFLTACGGGQVTSGRHQVDDEVSMRRSLVSRYPESEYISAVSCGRDAYDVIKDNAKGEVSRQIKSSLMSVVDTGWYGESVGDSASESMRIKSEVQIRSDFAHAEWIRSDSADMKTMGGMVCVVAHLDRHAALTAMQPEWEKIAQDIKTALEKAQRAFTNLDTIGFSAAYRDGRRAVADMLASRRIRHAIGAHSAMCKGVCPEIMDLSRMGDMAGKLLEKVTVSIGSAASSGQTGIDVAGRVAALVQDSGGRPRLSDADDCGDGDWWHLSVNIANQCRQDWMGQVCTTAVAVTGTECNTGRVPMKFTFDSDDGHERRHGEDVIHSMVISAVGSTRFENEFLSALGRILPVFAP